MNANKFDETFYDVLKVDRKATIAEIVAAYHSAKAAFSKDSVATYSLFSPEEVQAVLGKLEEAYLTLSNVEKRVEYDRSLNSHGEEGFSGMSEREKNQNAQVSSKVESAGAPTLITGESAAAQTTIDFNPGDMKGPMLKETREKRGLSLEDVARITKIPSKFIKAIEADDIDKMPARVYVQGFVKNLASLYKLDVEAAVKAYLTYLDQKFPSSH